LSVAAITGGMLTVAFVGVCLAVDGGKGGKDSKSDNDSDSDNESIATMIAIVATIVMA
jgi:hypothetical protein